jgi:hypothetical protein
MSEATVDELDAAHAIHPVATLQSEFSLWERGPVANGVLDWCRTHGAAFIPFAPLGRGFLTGQVTRETITAGDMRGTNPRFTPEAIDQNLAIVDRVLAVADRHDAAPGQVALLALGPVQRDRADSRDPATRPARGELGGRPPRALDRGPCRARRPPGACRSPLPRLGRSAGLRLGGGFASAGLRWGWGRPAGRRGRAAGGSGR